MNLADFIAQRELTLECVADEIGGVSVSGLRKWLAGERVPRPDQMRRIFDWSGGAVAPNDFVLFSAQHVPAASSLERKSGASGQSRHVNVSGQRLPAVGRA